ncbi:MAG: ACP S-malonyltransferase [Gammaproteobacteria bacterium]|nr:ACP S-malonyltransferase [Gammaproteobacteria bacterium]
MVTQTLGVVFPGQGSQSVGMLSDIAREFPIVEKTFEEASFVLGYDLWKLVQSGPAEELDKTVHTQPALLAAAYAIWSILEKEISFKPALLAGHSLGEYAALVCAKAMSFSDGIRLVAARGLYMQEAAPIGVGGLGAVIGLDDAAVQDVCHKSVMDDEVLSPANFNCPGQVVVAGHLKAVERALVLAKAQGAKLAKLLPVSVSSHCALMQPAAERLTALLPTIAIETPTIPVISNVDVVPYTTPQAIRDGLVRQLVMPVRWVETIQLFSTQGITDIVECGPGKVLNGLNKRIAKDIQLTNSADLTSLKALLAQYISN